MFSAYSKVKRLTLPGPNIKKTKFELIQMLSRKASPVGYSNIESPVPIMNTPTNEALVLVQQDLIQGGLAP